MIRGRMARLGPAKWSNTAIRGTPGMPFIACSIRGPLLAIGVTALVLTNGTVRRGEGWARLAVAVMAGLSEGNNAYRMYPCGSPCYSPLGFAVLAVVGAALAGSRAGPHAAGVV